MVKFRGDRPRDRGDLALKKKKRKKQQQNIRAAVALSQRAALTIKNARQYTSVYVHIANIVLKLCTCDSTILENYLKMLMQRCGRNC